MWRFFLVIRGLCSGMCKLSIFSLVQHLPTLKKKPNQGSKCVIVLQCVSLNSVPLIRIKTKHLQCEDGVSSGTAGKMALKQAVVD